MDIVIIIVGFLCMGKSEIFGNKLEDFFFFGIFFVKNVY